MPRVRQSSGEDLPEDAKPSRPMRDSNIATNKDRADDKFSAYDPEGEGRRKILAG